MQINEATICFVNSHLAAHASEVDRRKEDHDEIVQRMHFGNARRCIDDHEYVDYVHIFGRISNSLSILRMLCNNPFSMSFHAVTYFGLVTSTIAWSTIHRVTFSM